MIRNPEPAAYLVRRMLAGASCNSPVYAYPGAFAELEILVGGCLDRPSVVPAGSTVESCAKPNLPVDSLFPIEVF